MNDKPTISGKTDHKAGGNGALPVLDFWMNGSRDIAQRWSQSNSQFAKGVADLSQEFLASAQERFQVAADSWKSLFECRNPADLIECQRHFLEKATHQYFEESNKFAKRAVDIVNAALFPPSEQSKHQSPA